jgi:hypothetical protein
MANAEFYSCFEVQSLDRMSDVWEHSDDVRCTHPGWPTLKGWGAVSGSFFNLFQQGALACYWNIYIQTAFGTGLDNAVKDFFGDTLPRYTAEPDASYRTRAMALLFQPAATRPALLSALTSYIGTAPQIIYPWSPGDTGVWGDGTASSPGAGYWNVPSGPGVFRWATPRPYECLVITQLPAISVLGGNALNCLDDGFFFDSPGSMFADISGSALSGGLQGLYDVIEKVAPLGVAVWVQIVGIPQPVYGYGGQGYGVGGYGS